MQMGFNNDVEYRGLTVHIQTEDHGLRSKKITSQVFFSGAIVDSRTVSYEAEVADIADDSARDEQIRRLMKGLHRQFYRRIHAGEYDDRLPIEGDTPAEPKPEDEAVVEEFRVAGEHHELGDAYAAHSRGPAMSSAELMADIVFSPERAWRGLDESAQSIEHDAVAALLEALGA
ncbi:MAG: hypothetical protein R2713_24250 [Ilumatobacteraceae bacterium]